MARVTLQTIADRVGVSRMTVSNAFSRPDQLSAELRARVLAAAEELGYTGPDPRARSLATGSSGSIGVLLFDSLRVAFTDDVAIAFIGAIADGLNDTGRALTLLTSTDVDRAPGAGIPARDVPLDAAIVYSCDPDAPGTHWLLKRRLPLVMVDQVHREGHAHVNIDDRGGARAAAQHLVDLGHRRIALVSFAVTGEGGPRDVAELSAGYVSRERVLGWTDALTPAGIDPLVVQHLERGPVLEEGLVPALLDRDDPPTAVLCYSDAVAAALVTALADRGVRVPDDVSVVGYDDSPLAVRVRPALTTVRQDVVAKGRAAVAALLAQLDDPDSLPADVVLPTELVVRDSTAPPPR
ncbi:LacI family DNA-binding transcriptional regulator [Nocardioides aequoreus]|uniref:LacI family DNA-binding transcriptional regulator n=1 Tax=Nocardioides aequoreus TaxID=397278 RepID=UPI0004C42363|nr:LacI family DNA-binding transcriptional regulator [Nocardioides aequoreus]